jgi:hypothetical protein
MNISGRNSELFNKSKWRKTRGNSKKGQQTEYQHLRRRLLPILSRHFMSLSAMSRNCVRIKVMGVIVEDICPQSQDAVFVFQGGKTVL